MVEDRLETLKEKVHKGEKIGGGYPDLDRVVEPNEMEPWRLAWWLEDYAEDLAGGVEVVELKFLAIAEILRGLDKDDEDG